MKTIFTIALIAAGYCSFAQGEMYRLNTSNYLYSEFYDGTPFLTGPNKYVDTIRLPFKVAVAGVTDNMLYVTVRGSVSTTSSNIADKQSHLESFGTEHSNGTYSYQISGQSGNRIVKLQYRNVKFDHDMSGADYANYQVWLYESDKTMEIRFGKSSVMNEEWSYYHNAGGPAIGMKNLWLKGACSSPVADTSSETRLTGTPENGQIFQFFYKPVGIGDVAVTKPEVSVYPNPVTDRLFIKTTEKTDIVLTDISGRILLQTQMVDGSLDVRHLMPGIYLLHINDQVFKIFK
ncbi:MAG: T9SS type A sorting domain-containing protein [Sphingobacteriales bacterium]|nr:MAG: T9SS type A sorting domain-containing protein [Sphingobacteriales bacterium]